MQRGSFSGICAGLALVVGASMFADGQEPAGGRGGAQPISQFNRTPPVDAAAHDRGRALWASHCVDCHGTQARGSETGPNIIRTKTVNFDRLAAGRQRAGPVPQGGASDAERQAERVLHRRRSDRARNFLRQRVNDTMRGSALFVPGNILVGDAKPGRRTSTATAAAHVPQRHDAQPAGDRVAVRAPVDLQQRMLFPGRARRTRRRGRRRPSPIARP